MPSLPQSTLEQVLATQAGKVTKPSIVDVRGCGSPAVAGKTAIKALQAAASQVEFDGWEDLILDELYGVLQPITDEEIDIYAALQYAREFYPRLDREWCILLRLGAGTYNVPATSGRTPKWWTHNGEGVGQLVLDQERSILVTDELLAQITSLDLTGIPLADVSELAKLTGLQSLKLANTGLTDVAPLEALPALNDVDLTGNGLDANNVGRMIGHLKGRGAGSLKLRGNTAPSFEAADDLITVINEGTLVELDAPFPLILGTPVIYSSVPEELQPNLLLWADFNGNLEDESSNSLTIEKIGAGSISYENSSVNLSHEDAHLQIQDARLDNLHLGFYLAIICQSPGTRSTEFGTEYLIGQFEGDNSQGESSMQKFLVWYSNSTSSTPGRLTLVLRDAAGYNRAVPIINNAFTPDAPQLVEIYFDPAAGSFGRIGIAANGNDFVYEDLTSGEAMNTASGIPLTIGNIWNTINNRPWGGSIDWVSLWDSVPADLSTSSTVRQTVLNRQTTYFDFRTTTGDVLSSNGKVLLSEIGTVGSSSDGRGGNFGASNHFVGTDLISKWSLFYVAIRLYIPSGLTSSITLFTLADSSGNNTESLRLRYRGDLGYIRPKIANSPTGSNLYTTAAITVDAWNSFEFYKTDTTIYYSVNGAVFTSQPREMYMYPNLKIWIGMSPYMSAQYDDPAGNVTIQNLYLAPSVPDAGTRAAILGGTYVQD